MRERGITLLLALAALGAFYGIWLRPAPSLDPGDAGVRPTTAERRGNGYAALFDWLQSSGVDAQSFRDRYTALPDAPSRGNLLILSLPGVEVFRNDEFGALDDWIRRGNTLLINAALLDQPGRAAARTSGTVVEIESLTGIEFETREAREARLDPRPLADRVREADERDARKDDEVEEEDEGRATVLDPQTILGEAQQLTLTTTGPHALLAGVKSLSLESDYPAESWVLRMPYDNFVLTLARTPRGEGALFEQRLGEGRILLAAGGSMFMNRALGSADNARLMANIVGTSVAPQGLVLFDDLRQGLKAQYDPARFFRDSRLWRTVGILIALWFVWVLGSTRLRAPAIESPQPSEAGLVRVAGGLIARTVAPHHTALRLFDQFFARVARASRGAGMVRPERGDLWHWLERHAAILPQELDRLKDWYAQAHAERRVPLADLQNLLDNLERRLT
jgi:hypothetical protein